MGQTVTDKLNVQITADPRDFRTGMANAVAALTEFQKQASPLVGTVNNLARALTGLNTGGVTGGISSLVGSITRIATDLSTGNYVGAVAEVGAMATSLIDSGRQAILAAGAQARFASNLEMTTEEMAGFVAVGRNAGIVFEELNPLLTKAFTKLGEFRQAMAEGNVDSPLAVAVRRIGLDAEAISRLRPAEQFTAIADALNRLPASRRLFEARQIFGREAVELAPLLRAGSQGIRDGARNAFLSGADFQAAAEYRKTLKELEAAWEQIGTAIAFNLGQTLLPVLQDFAAWILENREPIREFFETVGRSSRDAGHNMSEVVSAYLAWRQVAWDMTKAPFQIFGHGRTPPADRVRELALAEFKKIRGMGKPDGFDPNEVTERSAELATANSEVWLASQRRLAEGIGRTSRELEIMRAAQRGVTSEVLDAMRAFDQWARVAERMGASVTSLRSTILQGLTPFRQFRNIFQDLQRAANAKVGLLRPDEAGAGQARAFLDLERQFQFGPVGLATASLFGSQDAFSLSQASRRDQEFDTRSVQERIASTLELARQLSDRQLQELQDISAALRGQPILQAKVR